MSEKLLIIGLGNFGEKFQNNRHNIGFLLLDYLLKSERFEEIKKKNYILYNADILNLTLIRPLTYMNLSGEVFKNLNINSFKKIIIVYDECDLKFGRLKIQKIKKANKTSHNGLKSIFQYASFPFILFKIGIAKDKNILDFFIPMSRTDFVLKNFSKSEMKYLEEKTFPKIKKAILFSENHNIEKIMNEFN